MRHLLLLLAFILCFLSRQNSIAQTQNIDSLINLVNKAPEDTSTLYNLGTISDNAADGIWQQYNEKLGKMCERLMASAQPRVRMVSKEMYSFYLNNKAFDYAGKAKYNQALECYEKCMKIQNEIGDKKGASLAMSSIGAIYDRVGETDKALEYDLLALRIGEEIGAKNNMTATLNNIGVLYGKKKDTIRQLESYRRAEKIINEEKLENQIVPAVYNGLGQLRSRQGDFLGAMNYFRRAKEVATKIGDNVGMARSFECMADLYFKQKEYSLSADYAKQALNIARSSDIPGEIRTSARLLKQIYRMNNDYKQALEMYDLETAAKDSLSSKENQKAILRHQFQTDFDIKQAKLSAEQVKKDIIAQEEINKQKTVRNTFIGGFVLTLIFAGIFFQAEKRDQEA